MKMSIGNRKILLQIMMGSHRKVNICAGGTFELNLSLFARVGDESCLRLWTYLILTYLSIISDYERWGLTVCCRPSNVKAKRIRTYMYILAMMWRKYLLILSHSYWFIIECLTMIKMVYKYSPPINWMQIKLSMFYFTIEVYHTCRSGLKIVVGAS